MLVVWRQHDKQMVAGRVEIAKSFSARLLGLIGRDRLGEGEGMFLRNCSNIHTFFMKFPIDVIYLDNDSKVVAVETNVKPWRMGGIHWRAKHVLELRPYTAGWIAAGDTLEFVEEGV